MTTPARTVIQGDAFAYLKEHQAGDLDAVVTSLPDVSELSPMTLEAWRDWFVATANQLMCWVPPHSVAIFYQSDIRRGAEWIDKGYLVMKAAELAGTKLIWHKIVCRRKPGTVAVGRPSYSHLLCFSRTPAKIPLRPGPDVLPDAGVMPWSRAMGVEACRVSCQYLLDETECRRVVDPFCGQGTVLAVANALGLDALGVELGGKRCRVARNLQLESLQVPAKITPA